MAASQNIYFKRLFYLASWTTPAIHPSIHPLCKKEHFSVFWCFYWNVFCCSIKFETNFSFFSSVKLEPCDEFLLLTFLSTDASQIYVFHLFWNKMQLKFHQKPFKAVAMMQESINHKTPNNDSMGSLLTFVCSIAIIFVDYHCWFSKMKTNFQDNFTFNPRVHR